ncbi:MAG: hypothetical protein KDD48_05225, partial [Bdellovibrionales bacterium]|nr:hypothetical protein [Bdellovibrionales bacterium]
FTLKRSQLKNLERMGEKSSENLIDALKQAKENVTLSKLMTALGIPNVGEVAAQKIAQAVGSLDYFLKIDFNSNNYDESDEKFEKLEAIHGVGPKMTRAIRIFFEDPKNRQVVQKLVKAGLNPKAVTPEQSKGPLGGKIFCITGTLSKSREEIKQDILNAGGQYANTVGKNVAFLVAGDNVGEAKLKKADKYNTKIISEEELYQMLSHS